VIADGRHSVPTSLEITATRPTGHVTTRKVSLPPIADSTVAGATTTVPLHFPAVTGRRIKITVTGVRLEYTTNYTVTTPEALPLGIATLGIPGLRVPAFPATVPGTCQSNLISIDGRPITVKIVGSTNKALDNGTLRIEPCGTDAAGITLSAGPNIIETQLADTPVNPSTLHCQATHDCRGWNVNRLTLDSAPGGGPEPLSATGSVPAPQPPAVPKVSTDGQTDTTQRVTVKDANGPFELVLGQSINSGWQAVAHPAPGAPPGSRPVSLGKPELVDSFANGWPVTSAQLTDLGATGGGGTHSFTVTLTWTPQQKVWVALGASGLTIAACAVVGFLPERWRRGLRRRVWPWRGRQRSRRRSRPEETRVTAMHAAPREGAAPVAPSASTSPVAGAVEIDASVGTVMIPDAEPLLAAPFSSHGHRPPWWTVIGLVVVSGVVAGAISAPYIGLVAGLAVAVALVVPRVRAGISLAAVGFIVAGAISVVAGQALHPQPESSNWPAYYHSAAGLVWIAVVFLGADALVEVARRLAARRTLPPTSSPGP